MTYQAALNHFRRAHDDAGATIRNYGDLPRDSLTVAERMELDAARQALQEAHEAAEKASVPYIETDRETAYGSVVRLSRSIRVF